jgi:hypothetical protein
MTKTNKNIYGMTSEEFDQYMDDMNAAWARWTILYPSLIVVGSWIEAAVSHCS